MRNKVKLYCTLKLKKNGMTKINPAQFLGWPLNPKRPPTAWKPNHAVESRSMRSFSNEKPGPEGKLFLRGVFIQWSTFESKFSFVKV